MIKWLKENVIFVGKTRMYMEGKFAKTDILHASHVIGLPIAKYVIQNLNEH
jgi:hypothetical protein